MQKIEKFEEDNIISFSNQQDLILFVSKYLSNKYIEYLLKECISLMDSIDEVYMWEEKYRLEGKIFEKKITIKLRINLFFKKKIIINYKSLEKILRKIGNEMSFHKNVRYEISNLTFRKL